MTKIRADRSNSAIIEWDLHRFCVDASDLGLVPGESLPREIPTDLGNGQPFVLAHLDGFEVARYVQSLGCIDLKIFND